MKQTKDAYNRLRQVIAKYTYRESAIIMNQEGYKTKTGKKWTASIIATWVFNNRINRGLTPARKAVVPSVKVKILSANQKLNMIKEIVMGLH